MIILRTNEDVENHIYELTCDEPENSLGMVSRGSPRLDIAGISVEQSLPLLYQHSTGAVVWNSTPKFASWIRTSPLQHLVKDQTVIELGCGTGALALLLSDFVNKYIATDQKPLLKLAQRNCAELSNVIIHELDWETQVFEGTQDEGVVIACDTIYNEFLIVPFIEAVESVFESSPNISASLVCVQVREPSILEIALRKFTEKFGPVTAYNVCPGYVVYLLKREEWVRARQ